MDNRDLLIKRLREISGGKSTTTTLRPYSRPPAGSPVGQHGNDEHNPAMAEQEDFEAHEALIGSDTVLGHYKVGDNLEVDESGFLNASGVSTFIALEDTEPTTFAGSANFLVAVNSGQTGLIFVDGDTLFAAVDHDHDGDYLSQAEADLLYASIGHNHDLAYASISHNHTGVYSPVGHDHSGVYSPIGHNHDASYSLLGHLQAVTAGGTGLTAIAADQFIYGNGVNTYTAGTVTAFARTLLDDTTASNMRTTLELNAGEMGDIWVPRAGGTMTGALLLANGTVSAPAVAFASSTGTGLYRIGADILGFAVAGAEAVRMEADGDVLVANKLGVGITPSVKFHISQSVDGDVAARVQNPNAGTSARAYFQIVGDAAGLVGYFGVGSSTHTTFASTFFLVSDSGATGGMLFRPAAGGVRFAASGSSANDLIVAASSVVYIGTATANSKMSRGLTINQAGFDDDIFALQSTDVAHGMTDIDDTATFCAISKINAADGGAALKAFTEATIGLFAIGYVTTEDTAAKSTSSVAAVMVDGRKKSGTGVTGLGATANIFAIRNNNATQVVVAGNGDTYQNGTGWTTYDAFDDLKLLDEVEKAILNPFDALRDDWVGYLHYNRSILEKAGLVHFNPDGHHFVNNSGMLRLHNGALRQIHSRLERIEERMSVIEEALGI